MSKEDLQYLHDRMVWGTSIWFGGPGGANISGLNAMRYMLADIPEFSYSWGCLSHLIDLQLNRISIEGYCD
jgi:hypothetical protein